MWHNHRVFIPFVTIQNWVEAAGKKEALRFEREHLPWALTEHNYALPWDTGGSASNK